MCFILVCVLLRSLDPFEVYAGCMQDVIGSNAESKTGG